MANFGDVTRAQRPRDLKLPKGRLGSFNRKSRDLTTDQLQKRVARLTTKFQGNNTDPALRAKLLGYRRGLTQRLLSVPKGSDATPFGKMSRQDRRAALKKKLGNDFGNYYFQKNKGPSMPPAPKPYSKPPKNGPGY